VEGEKSEGEEARLCLVVSTEQKEEQQSNTGPILTSSKLLLEDVRMPSDSFFSRSGRRDSTFVRLCALSATAKDERRFKFRGERRLRRKEVQVVMGKDMGKKGERERRRESMLDETR
jgi:hypothetical protein